MIIEETFRRITEIEIEPFKRQYVFAHFKHLFNENQHVTYMKSDKRLDDSHLGFDCEEPEPLGVDRETPGQVFKDMQ